MSFQFQFVQEDDSVDYTPDADVAAGQVVVQNALVGIAVQAIPANTLGALLTEGIGYCVKANEALNAGAIVYWDADGDPYGGTAGTGCLTATSSGNTFAGKVIAAAGATDATALLMLGECGSPTNTIHETISAVIADPGDAGAIPVTGSGNCPLVSAGAETRTLADPTFAGQLIALDMKTDGGAITVTAAHAIDAAGDTHIVFDDTSDTVLLRGVTKGAGLVWRLAGSDGVTLS